MLLLLLLLQMVFISDALKFIAPVFPHNGYYFVNRKSNITISCELDDPTAPVDLYKRENLAKDSMGDRLVANYQIFTIYNLISDDHAPYSCRANSDNGVIILDKGTLVVHSAACVEQPVITEGQLKIFEKGENISLTCKAPGTFSNQHKYLLWKRKNNQSLASNELINSTRMSDERHKGFIYDVEQLRITNGQDYDAGVYICERKINTCSNETKRSVKITLKYRAPFVPKITNLQKSIFTKLNSNFTINCTSTASPKPTIKWMLGNRTLSTCLHSNVCALSWKSTSLSNNGSYTCIAENTEGKVEKYVKVLVIVKTKINSIHSSSDESILTCETSAGYPKPNIYWQKEIKCTAQQMCDKMWLNVTVYSSIHDSVTSSGLKSVINFDETEEYGKFRCLAVNEAGESMAELYLSKKGNRVTALMIVIICGIILFVIITAIACYVYRVRIVKKNYALYMSPDPKFHLDPDRTLFEQSIELPYAPEWEFPKERLNYISALGAGAFGQVWLATAHGIAGLTPRERDTFAIRRRTSLRLQQKVPKKLLKCLFHDELLDEERFVAVKTLKANPSDVQYKDLASEIKVLIHLGSHPNIVNLLGACTKGGNLCAIIEYCPHGNLVNFLRARRDVFSLQWGRQGENYDDDFCFLDATYTALQIAKGMLFLSNKKLVHRDLAARNILVGGDYTMKVADFGLSRNIEEKDYYFKESSGMLPVKWMAPESIFDKLYTIKSDVWSFGILLWEICTMGGSPYPGLSMEHLLEYLQTGHRMEQPVTCPDELYELMVLCWQENMGERPWFNEVVAQLEQIILSKLQMSDNLATFERLQSSSSETDYLVPRSPVKKKGSLDTLLGMQSIHSNFNNPRKKSCDVLRFPPTGEKNQNNNQEMLNPIDEQRYVSIQSPAVFQNSKAVALDCEDVELDCATGV